MICSGVVAVIIDKEDKNQAIIALIAVRYEHDRLF